MPSTYSERSSLELQAAGENLNVWGDPKLNNNFKKIDFATKGVVSFALSGSITLTSSTTSTDPADIQSVAATINVTGGTGGTITVPSRQGTWTMRNASSGNITITTGSGATAVIAPGDVASVICDGTNVYREIHADFGGQRLKNVGTPTQPTDATTKGYVDNAAFSSALPAQAGNGGKLLGTDGTNASWQTVLPAFPGTTDYILTSNGSNAVWSTPAQTRVKLALGGAALLNVGTTSGTVAAGDDTRISGAMPRGGGTFTGQVNFGDAEYNLRLASNQTILNLDNNDYISYFRDTNIGRYFIAGTEVASWSSFGYRSPMLTARTNANRGYAILRGSDNGDPGTVEYFTEDGIRRGYMGFSFGSNNLAIASETGWNYNFTQRPLFNGQRPYDTGNITYGTAAPGTLAVGAIYLQHAA